MSIVKQRSEQVVVDRSLLLVDRKGYRELCVGTEGVVIASENPEQWAWAARAALNIADRIQHGSRIAHLGGGFACLARLLAIPNVYEQHIYEIDPDIADFIGTDNPSKLFVRHAGDWRETIDGVFDVIVWDVPDEITKEDRAFLAPYLSERGFIYPEA